MVGTSPHRPLKRSWRACPSGLSRSAVTFDSSEVPLTIYPSCVRLSFAGGRHTFFAFASSVVSLFSWRETFRFFSFSQYVPFGRFLCFLIAEGFFVSLRLPVPPPACWRGTFLACPTSSCHSSLHVFSSLLQSSCTFWAPLLRHSTPAISCEAAVIR